MDPTRRNAPYGTAGLSEEVMRNIMECAGYKLQDRDMYGKDGLGQYVLTHPGKHRGGQYIGVGSIHWCYMKYLSYIGAEI